MLPSLAAGNDCSTTVPIDDSKSGQESGVLSKRVQLKEDEKELRNCTILPLITEGSSTSLVSRKSRKSTGQRKESADDKGHFLAEDIMGDRTIPPDQEAFSMKTTQLQLNCSSRNVERGFCPQSVNPRLAQKLTRPYPLPVIDMMTTSERLTFQQTVCQPVETLQRRKNQVERRDYLTPFGEKAVLNSRYTLPSFNSLVSSNKRLSSVMLQVASMPVPPKRDAVEPSGTLTIHSRCPCRKHRGNYSWEKTRTKTLQSRSSDSLATAIVQLQSVNSKGSTFLTQNAPGLKSETRVKPTGTPPSKKQPSINGMSVAKLRNKSKRTSLAASESNTGVQDHNRRRKQSVSKISSRGGRKPLVKKKEETESLEQDAILINLNQEPHTGSVPIVVESLADSNMEQETELVEEMDVETDTKGQQLENSVEKPESIDSISVRSSAEPQRINTPRLLRLNTDQKMTLPALSEMFRKLDADCDGHISFAELAKSLPKDLSKQQINYIKKIYVAACESTYFGLEEFAATHHMCDLLGRSSPLVSDAISSLDSTSLDVWLKTYMDAFASADKNQSGALDILSFQRTAKKSTRLYFALAVSLFRSSTNMFGSVMNVHPESFVLQKILRSLNKSIDDTITGVELLAYIPFFAVAAPKES